MTTRETNVSTILRLDDASLALLAKVANELPLAKLREGLAAAVEIDTGRGHSLTATTAREHARALLLGALDALRRTT